MNFFGSQEAFDKFFFFLDFFWNSPLTKPADFGITLVWVDTARGFSLASAERHKVISMLQQLIADAKAMEVEADLGNSKTPNDKTGETMTS